MGKTKKEIRKEIKALKEELTLDQIQKLSRAIAQNMINSKEFKKASVIYPYVAYNQEVITDDIINEALRLGKRVAAPKVFDDYMEFLYITDLSQCEPGYFNIPEPVTTQVADEKEVLIIMPGIAFDPDHNRIGYGGGFYDKYLASHPDTNFTKIALTYDFQILEHVETEEHDYKVDGIITPTRIL